MNKELLKAWDLIPAIIFGNKLILAQRPTTQEDNFGDILDRWDCYYTFDGKLNNGLLSDMKEGRAIIAKAGRLVKYNNGGFSFFTNSLRFENATVEFI